jgi:fructoselysine-6-P-deglycase FrlB-like protein
MTNNRNKLENERLAQHKRQKTNRGVIIVGCGSSSSQNDNSILMLLKLISLICRCY